MNLTLTSQQLLSLYVVLDRAKGSCDFKLFDTIDEINSQIETKILDSLTLVEGENSKNLFAVWQKKESKKIQELESELNDLKLANDALKNSPNKIGILGRKKNKF